jgi:hypothetical protein
MPRSGPTDAVDSAVDGLHELAVANPSFFVEKLGAECSDLQGLRELTVNGLQAIAALGDGARGRVVWDIDWQRVEATCGRVRKLSVIDDGVGMTPGQMRYFINHLAASSHEQGRRSNYGVGAKIAAGSRNPHGLEYRSWHHGQGALVRFRRHADGRWGLEPQVWVDGRTDFWRPLGEDDKPWLLRGREHGTQVVLLGSSEREDTTSAPTAALEARGHWVTRYLNTRFLCLPAQAEVLVREGQRITSRRREAGNLLIIHGQLHHLQRRAVAAGALDLSDARVHWWILDADDRGRATEALRWNSSGHAGALLDNELYEVPPKTRGGYQRVQEFGVRFGYDRVVLYLEPLIDDRDRVESNTARTLLLIDNEPLPWGRWAEEFRAAMPAEIQRLQERVAGDASDTARRENIRARLRAHGSLYRVSRYRPPRARRPRQPGVRTDHQGPSETIGPARARAIAEREPSAGGHDAVPVSGDMPDQRSAAQPDDQLPDVTWVSVRDGSRAPGELEDRAARYHRDLNQLTINADFRVFTDMVARWTRPYRGVPGARPAIEALVREWFEQTLIEAVLSARALEGSPHWNSEQIDELVSESALVSACLPRQLLNVALHKRLAQRLGREAVRQRP